MDLFMDVFISTMCHESWLTGTLTWFFGLSQILSKSAKIRKNLIEPTQGPSQN